MARTHSSLQRPGPSGGVGRLWLGRARAEAQEAKAGPCRTAGRESCAARCQACCRAGSARALYRPSTGRTQPRAPLTEEPHAHWQGCAHLSAAPAAASFPSAGCSSASSRLRMNSGASSRRERTKGSRLSHLSPVTRYCSGGRAGHRVGGLGCRVWVGGWGGGPPIPHSLRNTLLEGWWIHILVEPFDENEHDMPALAS